MLYEVRSVALRPAVARYLHLERYVNRGSKTYSPRAEHSEVSPTYQPEGGAETFEVPVHRVPRGLVTVFSEEPSGSRLREYVAEDSVRFCVHPDLLGDARIAHLEALSRHPRLEALLVAPTASTRTVVVLNSETDPHHVKLHLPRRISTFVKAFARADVGHCVAVSRQLEGVRCEKFAYLPEVLGIALSAPDGWGFTVRELTPRPLARSGPRTLVPFFSLYAEDVRHPGEPMLLVKLVERSGEDPKRFLLERLLFPVIECWCEVVRQRGILLESHAQNTLFELDEDGLPARIVHRDFNCWVDGNLRAALGLSPGNFADDMVLRESLPGRPREGVYSLVYDNAMGYCFFECLAEAAHRAFGIAPEELEAACARWFEQRFPEFRDYFSDEVFGYGKVPTDFNTFPIVPKPYRPEWRPPVR